MRRMMKEMILGQKLAYILTFSKYIFSICLTLIVLCLEGNGLRLISCLCELAVIFFLSNILAEKSRTLGIIVNIVLMFFYNAQVLVCVFARSYISYQMLSNLDSLEDISGKAGTYILGITLSVIFSLFPVCAIKKIRKSPQCLLVIFAGYFVFLLFTESYSLSPMIGVCRVYSTFGQQKVLEAEQKRMANSSEDIKGEFYKAGINGGRDKPKELPENPNVIIIFTEGLSSSVIEDERKIMPNVARLQSQSISFQEYYNHTFATYRGLLGQLYSGYQKNNYDRNSLVSLQDIFKKRGYHTFFLNTEPNNHEFTSYLENFGFDELINPEENPPSGGVANVSDKKAYKYFFEKIESLKEPFFGVMYTLDTHATFVPL